MGRSEGMELFIERLIETIFTLLACVTFIGIFVFPIWLLHKISPVMLAVLFLTILGIALIYCIWEFVYWLFVEPFKYSKRK
jgi:hypothetical protein